MTHKISVSAIVIYKGKLLMIKESQNGVIAWDIPAGGIDLGENLENAIIREVFEEANMRIHNPKLLRTFCFIESDKTTINFLYLAHIDNYTKQENMNKLINQEEILDLRFFDIDEINNIIKQQKYEHNLAKARLEVFTEQLFGVELEPINITN